MNIKGLYFKLNVDKQQDEEIYRFFTMEADKKKINKIDLLYALIIFYNRYNKIKEGAIDR